MKRIPAIVTLLLFLSGAIAQEPEGEETRSVAEQLASLEAERDESGLRSNDLYQAYRPRFEEFAEEHAGTEEALTASLWLIRNSWSLRRAEGAAKMYEASQRFADPILEDYLESPRLEELSGFDYVFSADYRQEVFGKIFEGSPHASVKAAALYSLAKADRRARDDAAKARRRERLLTLAKDYGELPFRLTTYGEIADANLNPIDRADLELGKIAPEIVGADHLGNEMKLSDYRGKVVVLDFWGDW